MARQQLQKKVQMVAYDADQNFGISRDWAQELIGEDLHETETLESEDVKLRYNLSSSRHRENTIEVSSFNFDDEGLQEAKDQLSKVDDSIISLEHEKSTQKVHARSLSSVSRSFMEEVVECLPDEIDVGDHVLVPDKGYDSKRKYVPRDPDHPDDADALKVWITDKGFDKRRVLAKESERLDDDLYETMAEVPSLKLRIKINGMTEDHIEKLTEAVVPAIHKELSSFGAVGKVRYTGCQVSKKMEGECYNIG